MANQTQCCNKLNMAFMLHSLRVLEIFPVLQIFPVLIFGVEVGCLPLLSPGCNSFGLNLNKYNSPGVGMGEVLNHYF